MTTIKTAKKENANLWRVEYNEFEGSYFLHDTEYKLAKYVEKILQERTILPKEIETLLDLQADVVNSNRDMDECD